MALGTLVLGYCLMQFDNGTASSGLSWLSVGMTMMCIAGYAMSAAPVVWILCSEIQPLKCRDFGITCSTTTNWVSNMIIGATFLTQLRQHKSDSILGMDRRGIKHRQNTALFWHQ